MHCFLCVDIHTTSASPSVSSVRWCFPSQPRWPRLTQREPEPGAAANQFLSVRYSHAATSPATARHQLMSVFWAGWSDWSLAVSTKAEHRPGFHKRWSADPQPVPIGGTYFTICSLQPEVPSCRSCSSAALISCSPSRTSTLATYFNIWTIVHNYTHQKPSKEGL